MNTLTCLRLVLIGSGPDCRTHGDFLGLAAVIAIYYIFFLIVGLFASPLLLFKRKARAGIWQKLGFVPARLKGRSQAKPIWIHAVSVGEFNAIWPLLSELHRLYPKQAIVISTTTRTGQELAKQRAGQFAEVFYFPFDLPWATASWLNTLQPAAVMIVETEIWPGFYRACGSRGIPLIIVNGRISPRSFKRYKFARALFGNALRQASLILAQSQEEATRYRDLTGGGVPLAVTGNLKFDGLKTISAREQSDLREQLGLAPDDLVIVAGSTHEGEEAAILRTAKELGALGKLARVILVPRHPERFNRVTEIIQAHGFEPIRFSKNETFTNDNQVYLLDTIGQLMRFYSLASIAFVGGTLVPVGGHNLVEPCAYCVPVVCGPHVEKTRDVARALIHEQALLLGADEQAVSDYILKLAADSTLRASVGRAGNTWLSRSQGAVLRALTSLQQHDGVFEKPITAQDTTEFAEAKR